MASSCKLQVEERSAEIPPKAGLQVFLLISIFFRLLLPANQYPLYPSTVNCQLIYNMEKPMMNLIDERRS
jgi:hypothetical protein